MTTFLATTVYLHFSKTEWFLNKAVLIQELYFDIKQIL